MNETEINQCYKCDGVKPCYHAEDHYTTTPELEGYCVWKATIYSDIAKYLACDTTETPCLTFDVSKIPEVKEQRNRFIDDIVA